MRVVPCIPIGHGHIPILSQVKPCIHTTTISFELIKGHGWHTGAAGRPPQIFMQWLLASIDAEIST